MQLLAFDWYSMMAHFRKLDTNSSSLSYPFPTPTVIMGMLAGLLGMERGSYYELMGVSNLQIGIQFRSKIRKMTKFVNYLLVKHSHEFADTSRHTQVPLEILINQEFPEKPLCYRIFLRIKEDSLFDRLSNSLQRNFVYPPYMGSASFRSWIEPVPIVSSNRLPAGLNQVHTLFDPSHIDRQSLLGTLKSENKCPSYARELVRREFLPGRIPGNMVELLYENNRMPVQINFLVPPMLIQTSEEQIGVDFI